MKRPWRVEYQPPGARWRDGSPKWYCDSTHTTEARAKAAKEDRSHWIPRYDWRVRHRDAPVT